MLEVIKNRRSCRTFDYEKAVEEEKINEIVQAGLLAPSGKGSQDPIVIVIKDKKVRDELSKINAKVMGAQGDNDPFYGAPVILLVACKKNPYPELDGGAMIENMLLEATNQGLSTCWIHRAKAEWELPEFRELLKSTGIAFDEFVGVDHIALGYNKGGQPREKAIKEGRVFRV